MRQAFCSAVGLDVGVVVEEAVVGDALEVGAAHGAGDGGACVVGGVVAEVLRVVADEVDGEQVLAAEHLGVGCRRRRPSRGARSRRGCRSGPAGTTAYSMSGPTARAKFVGSVHGVVVQARARTAVRPSASAFAPGEREGDGDGLVLAHLVDVVVHAQLVVRQRRLVAPAVRQHAVALVGEALVVQGLERPDHRLHEGDVERLVVVLR